MDSSQPNKKSKEYQLERIRNNQRRSRARQREYIAELEEKVRGYEAGLHVGGGEANPVEALRRENGQLRGLLLSMGLDEASLGAYIKAAERGPQLAQALSVILSASNPVAQGNEELGSTLSTNVGDEQSESFPLLFPGGNSAINTTPASMFGPMTISGWQDGASIDASSSPLKLSPSRPATVSQVEQLQNFYSAISTPDQTSLFTQLQAVSSDGVTPCSLAYSLVVRFNRTGHDAADIDLKLLLGYREYQVEDGCAVENRILFGVLAEIS